MTAQLTFSGEMEWRVPLSVEDRQTMFAKWCELNPLTLAAIEHKARQLAFMGHKRISTQFLIEWARYELTHPTTPVTFVGSDGKRHRYGINNTDCAALGRYLKKRYPDMPIELRRSKLDGAS